MSSGIQAFLEPDWDDRLPSRIAEGLKDAILQGHIAPGERLNEIELAAAAGTSRTPVREAIRILEAIGLVVSIPRRGARVVEITAEALANNYLCRAQLYGLAARVAAVRRTDAELTVLRELMAELDERGGSGDHLAYLDALVRFGDQLVEVARVPELGDLLTTLKGPSLLVRFQAASTPSRTAMVLEQYRTVLKAVEDGDSPAAQESMSLAIRESGKWLLSAKFPQEDPEQLRELRDLLDLAGTAA